jgi:ubiquinone biosynthesis monooxygenase Coq7
VHLRTLSRLLAERRVRPTALLPLWSVAGFALGAATASLGREAAMACTVAVETVIGEHYNDQIRSTLAAGYGDSERELTRIFRQHRDEELEHLHTAMEEGAARAPLYSALSAVIRAGCSAAIAVARRV